ncbi:hypothetical protein Tco_1014280 [Tanacetum coccineum]
MQDSSKEKGILQKSKFMMPVEDDIDWYTEEIGEQTEKVCLLDSDNELLIPTPWSDESKNEKKGKKVPSKNNIGKLSHDLVDMPSEAVEQGMDDHVPDEIDGVKCHTYSDASIGGKKGDLEFLVCKQVPNHGGDELVDKGRPMKRKRVYAD